MPLWTNIARITWLDANLSRSYSITWLILMIPFFNSVHLCRPMGQMLKGILENTQVTPTSQTGTRRFQRWSYTLVASNMTRTVCHGSRSLFNCFIFYICCSVGYVYDRSALQVTYDLVICYIYIWLNNKRGYFNIQSSGSLWEFIINNILYLPCMIYLVKSKFEMMQY